jgi:hypothetical protein
MELRGDGARELGSAGLWELGIPARNAGSKRRGAGERESGRRVGRRVFGLVLARGNETAIRAIIFNQLGVGAAFDDPAVLENEDVVGCSYRIETMSDDDRGTARQ